MFKINYRWNNGDFRRKFEIMISGPLISNQKAARGPFLLILSIVIFISLKWSP